MPLPPAPTKRAALLSTNALHAPVRAPARSVKKSGPAVPAERQVVIDLFENRVAEAGEHPAAFLDKSSPGQSVAVPTSYKKESVSEVQLAPQAAYRPKRTKHTGPRHQRADARPDVPVSI
jgi:PhoH-like ATPase